MDCPRPANNETHFFESVYFFCICRTCHICFLINLLMIHLKLENSCNNIIISSLQSFNSFPLRINPIAGWPKVVGVSPEESRENESVMAGRYRREGLSFYSTMGGEVGTAYRTPANSGALNSHVSHRFGLLSHADDIFSWPKQTVRQVLTRN